MNVNRRKFLGSSAAAVIAAGTMAKGKVFGANDRIQVAVIGINGQGGSHLSRYLKNEGSQVIALCDPDQRVLGGRAKQVKSQQGDDPKLYTDVRDLLKNDDLDAVSIATPNHWHSLAAIWACQAKKDVYVEKPLSHTFWEGKQLVAAAKKYDCVVQHGTQSRSDADIVRAMKLIHDGFIGDVVMSRGVVYKNGNRHDIGHGEEMDPPASLDWDVWLGPAPVRPYRDYPDKKGSRGIYVHYNWHWFWDFGNGETGNQGVHEMDVACWGMNKGLPSKVFSAGGRYGWDDIAETPNTQASTFTYPDGTMLEFEVRNLGSYQEAGAGDCTNSVFGTKGYWVRTKGFFGYDKKPIEVTEPMGPNNDHIANFLQAVRTRKPEDNYASASVGHDSCAHIHLANIAYKLGHSLEFDPDTDTFVGTGATDANKMLKRDYREPFVVPEIA
ncbi:MAG: Gfo/Idh/MocA family oxidoreductase [bacterium]|nr:Gfo/Idh/MocA family oxidoreductase [bacterium]